MAVSVRSVLFVDDHPFTVRGLVGYVHKLDPELRPGVAHTVASAAMQLNKEPLKYQAAVIDYRLPDNNGLVLIDWIRRKYPRIGTILYASEVEDDIARKAMDMGVLAVLPKGADSEETITQMYRALGWPVPPMLQSERAEFESSTVPSELEFSPSKPPVVSPADFDMDPREALVLALIMNGKSNKEIARATGKSVATVKVDVAKLLRWGGTESRSALGAYAYAQGLTPAALERYYESKRSH